jgi:hypothetical protein
MFAGTGKCFSVRLEWAMRVMRVNAGDIS